MKKIESSSSLFCASTAPSRERDVEMNCIVSSRDMATNPRERQREERHDDDDVGDDDEAGRIDDSYDRCVRVGNESSLPPSLLFLAISQAGGLCGI